MWCCLFVVSFLLLAAITANKYEYKVRSDARPWLMAHWKPIVDFLFALIELSSLSATVPKLWGEMCTARLFSQGVDLFALRDDLGRVAPNNHYWHQKTRDTAATQRWRQHRSAFPCFDTIPECAGQTDRQTDGWTDGFAVAYTPLAKLYLRRGVKWS